MGNDDPSIDELVAQLEGEHDAQFVYRGQSRDYGVLLPSGLRGAEKSIDGGEIKLDRRTLVACRTVRAAEQARFRQGMARQFGAGIGHLLAQQYGLGSDVIDITSSPRIAAFFATRRWPTCSHIAEPQDEPGIIYRWRKPEPPRTPVELKADTFLGSVTRVSVEGDTPVRAIVEFPEQDTAEHVLARDAQDAWALFPSMISTYQEILATMTDHLEKSGGEYTAGWAFQGLPESRWAAQAGGFLRPATVYRAYLGPPPDGGFKIIEDPALSELRLDRRVIGGVPDVISDAAQVGAPAVFRFRHTASCIDIAPEQLWPPPDQDVLFRYVAILAWTRHGQYFDEVRANYPWDRIAGLVDRGFYPEDEDEAHELGEWEMFGRVREPGSLYLPPVRQAQRTD